MEPGFFLSYWRPWDESSSFVDSWGDYLRDKSMAEYGANLIGEHIREASQEQIFAIEAASQRQIDATKRMSQEQTQAIRQAAESIGFTIHNEMSFLNKRLDISLEQQRLSLMLQKNISELLMIPDSEKERQQAITLGIQFFVNASKDPDLFDDALEEFLKAEQMKKQDYFVLHRIGCIYLYVEKHLNPQLAFDYFVRAGKYAAVESSPDALRLANLLTNSINADYTQQTSNPKQIMQLAADSYGKAALASYILGDNDNAVSYQQKALKYDESARNGFTLAKYLIRSGNTEEAMKLLEWAIDEDPVMTDAIFCDVDVAGDPKTIELVDRKKSELDNSLEEAILESFDIKPSCKNPDGVFSNLRLNEIATIDDNDSYINKAIALSALKNDSFASTKEELTKERVSLLKKLNVYKERGFISSSDFNLNYNLLMEQRPSADEWRETFAKVDAFLKRIVVKVGDRIRGGIIIKVDSSGKRGVMCADTLIGPTLFFRESDRVVISDLFDHMSEQDHRHLSDWHIANIRSIDPTIPKDFCFLIEEECKKYRIGGYNDWVPPIDVYLEDAIANARDIIKGKNIWSGTFGWINEYGMCVKYYDGHNDELKEEEVSYARELGRMDYITRRAREISKWNKMRETMGSMFILPIRYFNLEG